MLLDEEGRRTYDSKKWDERLIKSLKNDKYD